MLNPDYTPHLLLCTNTMLAQALGACTLSAVATLAFLNCIKPNPLVAAVLLARHSNGTGTHEILLRDAASTSAQSVLHSTLALNLAST
jgi:hypothetical protein